MTNDGECTISYVWWLLSPITTSDRCILTTTWCERNSRNRSLGFRI